MRYNVTKIEHTSISTKELMDMLVTRYPSEVAIDIISTKILVKDCDNNQYKIINLENSSIDFALYNSDQNYGIVLDNAYGTNYKRLFDDLLANGYEIIYED